VLFHLDRDGERITGDLAGRYVLEKHVRDSAIDGRRWRLVELRGSPIDGMELVAEPTLSFAADGSTMSGNASCNSFSGAYALKSGNRIRFARQLAVTLMACPDMSVEAEFLDVLQTADNYAIGSDGTLSLNRARMAPLARFAPVEGPE
jgi:copper homeostasis protein (lipoprotein)